MQNKLQHQKAFVNIVDKTKASRKFSLTEEYSLGFLSSDEFIRSERTEAGDVEFVHSVYQEILSECRFVSQEKLANIPRFTRNEVFEGLTLGKGGFGTINALEGFSLNTKEERRGLLLNTTSSSSLDFEEAGTGGEEESKLFIATHCFRNNGDARYALKRLRRKTLDDDLDCLRGTTDLANETLFLGSIDHPHIIKLRGISTGDICSKDFFIILDRLYDTLASRLAKWKAEAKKRSGLKRIFLKRGRFQRKDLLAERLNYASQLASALTYLHRHKIIHRDLKPENIGFNVRGDINIFDFGLARELPKRQKESSDKTFNLTMKAGTPRYMAPEVATGKYNEACDIYSAGLLLWEFITLKRPFKDQKSMEDFERNVWRPNGSRPKVPTKVLPGLQQILTRSWNHNFNERPSAMDFENALRCEISMMCEEENSSAGDWMDSSSTVFSLSSKGIEISPTTHGDDGSISDPIGASVNTFFTNSDRSGGAGCQSFRSEF